MSNLGLVHVAEMGGDTRSFPINGEGLTARDVIADFYPDSDVEELITERAFNLINRGRVRADTLDRPLVAGDTIMVMTNEVATGGVKGAISRYGGMLEEPADDDAAEETLEEIEEALDITQGDEQAQATRDAEAAVEQS